jgi:predicted small lipoprotein YifL
MQKHWIVALMATLVLLTLAACGGARPTSSPTGEPAEPIKTSAQAKPTAAPQATKEMTEPTAEPEPTMAPEPTSAPEEADLSLDDRAAGLDQLKSYRVSWKSEWESTKDGKTQQSTWDWLEEYTSDPQALHYVWKSTEDGIDKGGMELWQIGDTMYMVSAGADGTSNCSSFSSSDPDSGLQKGTFSPSMLGSLSGAKYVGRENVNGIATKHYKYDEKASSLAGLGKVTGETWVASDGGYVVKDVVNWEGGAGLFGAGPTAGESGKGTWAWELKDPNGSFTITPPEGCESAAKGLPIMPDATDKTTMGDLTIYTTASKAADVVAFYQKEMAAAGWKQSAEPTSMEGFATLEFAKDSQKASITITTEGEGSQVMINVSKEQ